MYGKNLKISNETRIKIRRENIIWHFIGMAFLALATACMLFVYIRFCLIDDIANNLLPHLIIISIFIEAIYVLISKSAPCQDEYLSDIVICNNTIKLEYSIKDKKTKTITIKKDNIEKFIVDGSINYLIASRILETTCNITINLKNGGKIEFKPAVRTRIGEPIRDLLVASSKIPNFESNIKSNHLGVISEIDYIKNCSKRAPLSLTEIIIIILSIISIYLFILTIFDALNNTYIP